MGEISVYNNGNGIDVAIHLEHNVYVPELIFGHLLTSTNYDDEEEKITGGKNGYGAKLSNIHEICSESYDFQNKLDKACKELGLKTISIGYDPVTKLSDAPNNPKERYKLMTKEMPKGGKLSLNMMYQTSGTQINLDYLSEVDFKKKFKIISYLTPISIAIFANSAILENKPSGYLSYRFIFSNRCKPN